MRIVNMKRVALIISMVAAVFAGGCTESPDDDPISVTAVAHAGETVSTDLANYALNAPVTVSWSGLPGNQLDWITVATAGSPPNGGFVNNQYTYTNGATSGSTTFSNLPAGNYEARAYSNNTYTILATSTFTVGGGGGSVVVSTDHATYAPNQNITISWSGFPGNIGDWVAITTAGSASDSGFQRYAFVNGQTSGSQTFAGLPSGSYEARGYSNNTYTIIGSSNFTVTGGVTISTDMSRYAVNQAITVTWSGLPGNATDYVSINTAGSAADSGFVQSFQTGGAASGSHTFAGVAAGSYEARAYAGAAFDLVAQTPFVVSSAMVTTNATTYTVGSSVVVTYSGLPGNALDWISIAPVGSSATTSVGYQFTGGATSGTATFTGIAAGTYEARAYVNNTYTIIATSPSFTITVSNACTAGGARPTFSGLQSGDLTMDATSAQATAALSVPLASSILFFSVSEREPSPYYGGVICNLHAADTMLGTPAGVTCDRNQLGTDTGSGTVVVHWSVATFSSGVTVQRGAVDTGLASPTSVALSTPAPLTSSFVLLGGNYNNGSGWGSNEFVSATLIDPNTLDVRTTIQGTQTYYQVVTMTGASVQRGSAALTTADAQLLIPITATPSGTFSMISYTTDNSNGVNASQLMVQSNLVDPSTLLIKRGAGGTNIGVSWEVVSLPFATQSNVTLFSAGQASVSEPVAGISASTCVGITGSQGILGQSGGSTDYAGADVDLVGEGAASLVVGTNALTLTRMASTSSAEIPWTVIDFSRNCDGT